MAGRELGGLQVTAALYLSPKEVSDRWAGKISEKTLANWRSDPSGEKGPRFKRFGNRILYPLDSVTEFEVRMDHGSTSEYMPPPKTRKRQGEKIRRPSRAKVQALQSAAIQAASALEAVEAQLAALTVRKADLQAEYQEQLAALKMV